MGALSIMSRNPTSLWFWPDLSEDKIVHLTEKQKQVFDLVCQGYSYKEIAYELCIAEVTVKKRIETLKIKLNAKNNPHLVYLFITLNKYPDS